MHNTANFTFEQEQIIIGSLLGDAYLTPIKKCTWNSAFYKRQCIGRKGYLKWHFNKLGNFSCSIKSAKTKSSQRAFNVPGLVQKFDIDESCVSDVLEKNF